MASIMIKAMRLCKPPLRAQPSCVASGIAGPEVYCLHSFDEFDSPGPRSVALRGVSSQSTVS